MGAPRKYDYGEIARLYQEGKTLAQVSQSVGCHTQTALRILKAQGIKRRRGGMRLGTKLGPRTDGREIIRLYQEGYSIREVARQVGCSFQNVQQTLAYNDIPRRPAHYSRKCQLSQGAPQ